MTTETTGASAPKTEFLDSPTQTVPLRWPVVIDGTTYREVTIRRINGREARAYHASILATLTQGAPIVVFPGLDLPQHIWDELDDDDVFAIDQALDAFIPERFAPLTALVGKLMGRPSDEMEVAEAPASAPHGGPNLEHGAS